MRIAGWFFLCLTLLGAQEEGGNADESEKVPKRSVRLLAVGNAPPFRQEIRDGIRYELPPPPGSLPPRKLKLVRQSKDGETEEEPTELGEMRLQLGRLTSPMKLREGAGRLELRDDKGELWAQLACPETGNFLVLLWTDPKVGNWSKPRMKIVPDGQEAGKVTFLNVSQMPVAIVMGPERRALKPLQHWKTDLGPEKPVSFQLGVAVAGGGIEREVALSLEQSENESTLVVMSDSDGVRARRPLKITRLRERVR